jgi:CheY-like chemotaxis protein
MAQAKVLVVEDDDQIRKLLVESLEERCHLPVDVARDGRDALHQIRTRPYSVVVLDLVMPYMTGVDFLDSLQILERDPSFTAIAQAPAVIVVTGCTSEAVPSDMIQERFPTIVRAVLRKPVDMNALATRVERLLG